MNGLLPCVLVVAAWLAPAAAAHACELAGPGFEEFTLTADPSDTTAPAAPVIESAEVVDHGGGEGSACSHNSCEGVGGVQLTLAPPAEEELGYRFRVVDGDPILGPGWDGTIWRRLEGGVFPFGVDVSQSFATTLEITAVDRAGNESPPVRKRLSWDGPDAGCATAAGAASPWLAALIALGLRRRGHRG